MLEWIEAALYQLAQSKDYGKDWTILKTDWWFTFAKNRITSTKHGADFFEVTKRALETKKYEYSDSEFDKNFALILKEHGVKLTKA